MSMSDNPEAQERAAFDRWTDSKGIQRDFWAREVLWSAWQARAALAQRAATPSGDPERREYDEAVEALRRAFCALPRFSFLLDAAGNVRRVPDKCGNWIDFTSAHELFDAEVVDALVARQVATPAPAEP